MSAKDKNSEVLTLRAHHICCVRSWSVHSEERGPAFVKVMDKIKAHLSQPDALVMVAEGIDELCRQCTFCHYERCASPKGDEKEVRKWDAILLRELGIPFGSCLTAREWQAALNKKIPFKLCQRCQWKSVCSAAAADVP